MVEQSILKADFHGCKMEVVSAQNPSLVALKGILIMETKNTWKVVTTEDTLKGADRIDIKSSLSEQRPVFYCHRSFFGAVLPKRGTVISIEVDGYVFKINGSNFLVKSSERTSRPVKKFLAAVK